MATIRFGINDKALENYIENEAIKRARDVGTALVKTMKEIRENAVKTWYKPTSAKSMNNATVYNYNIKSNKNNITITASSYVDEGLFESEKKSASERNYRSPYESVESWRRRHEKDGWTYMNRKNGEPHPALDMPYSIPEYLFALPWELGINGLPPKATFTGTGWVNKQKIKVENTTKDLNGRGKLDEITPVMGVRKKSLEAYVTRRIVDDWKDTFSKNYNN